MTDGAIMFAPHLSGDMSYACMSIFKYRNFFVASLVCVSVLGIILFVLRHGLLGACGTTEVSVHPNPDMRLVAVVYVGSCGATTSIGPIVAFRDVSNEGYIDLFVPAVASPLAVEWSDSSTLRILSPSPKGDLKVARRNGVDIEYYDYHFPHKEF